MLIFAIPVKADNTHFEDFGTTQENFEEGILKSCGRGLMRDIPDTIPKLTSIIYNIIQVAVPIVIIIFGSFINHSLYFY